MSAAGVTRRVVRFALPRLFSLRVLAVLALLVLIVGGGWLWFRNSSFASVKQVSVTGLSGPSVRQIKAALVQGAETMSTLDMHVAQLDAAVSRYPEVRTLSVSSHFPHAVTIHVYEQVPVAMVKIGGTSAIVDGAGDVLEQAHIPRGGLPEVPVKRGPVDGNVAAPGARAALAVLAAAPYSFLAHIEMATSSAARGVIVQLKDGPQLFFGSGSQLGQKWKSALAMIVSTDTHGASYIDVSDPQRPAAGAGAVTLPPNTSTDPTSTDSGGV